MSEYLNDTIPVPDGLVVYSSVQLKISPEFHSKSQLTISEQISNMKLSLSLINDSKPIF